MDAQPTQLPDRLTKRGSLLVRANELIGTNQHWSEEQRLEAQKVVEHDELVIEDEFEPETRLTLPVSLVFTTSEWSCRLEQLGRREQALTKPRVYGDLQLLEPATFQPPSREARPFKVVIMQTKGGVGKTTHAINLSATAAIDGANLWLQTTVWECLRQRGGKELFGPRAPEQMDERMLMASRVEIRNRQNVAINTLQWVFAPERARDELTRDEFMILYQSLARSSQLLFLDLGPIDLFGGKMANEMVREALQDPRLLILIPWTPNPVAFASALELVEQLVDVGVAAERIYGVAQTEIGRPSAFNPPADLISDAFGHRYAEIPFEPLVLERAMQRHLLPIFTSPAFRDAYYELLQLMLEGWAHTAS